MLMKLVGFVLGHMTLWVGIGFLGPLIAQLLTLSGNPHPLGIPALLIGLGIGTALGARAQWQGRWI